VVGRGCSPPEAVILRVAFVDLQFDWPPSGGAPVDLVQVMRGLASRGVEVRLFYARPSRAWNRRPVRESLVPVPAEAVMLDTPEPDRRSAPSRFRAAVDAWHPSVVVAGFGGPAKPWVLDALAGYPLVSRYYAYELTCPRDLRLYKNGDTCPGNYLAHPDVCRRCTVAGHGREIRLNEPSPYVRQAILSKAYGRAYYRVVRRSLERVRTVLVNNELEAGRVRPFHPDVRVVTAGVDTASFQPSPEPTSDRKVVMLAGRADDPIKGALFLRDAAERLAQARNDFEVHVTWDRHDLDTPWFRSIGWRCDRDVRDLYQSCAVCAVPSQWDEPFGMTAAEAMACGRPVVATRSGGLLGIVEDGVTGWLVDKHDPAAFAEKLGRLLDSADDRARMGRAGRERVERLYDWKVIVERHYLPLVLEIAT
jgi:glycosyltransferase involved in cell wall biosynthesis